MNPRGRREFDFGALMQAEMGIAPQSTEPQRGHLSDAPGARIYERHRRPKPEALLEDGYDVCQGRGHLGDLVVREETLWTQDNGDRICETCIARGSEAYKDAAKLLREAVEALETWKNPALGRLINRAKDLLDG